MKYVYFVQTPTVDGMVAVKIGIARNPHARIRELQCGNPCKMRLVAYVAGDDRLERRLHATFDSIGLRGEWFARIGKLDSLLLYLEMYVEENGNHEISFDQFETAISDNVANDSWMPVCPESEEEYEATADRALWREYEFQ
jgi:hypothetical protein